MVAPGAVLGGLVGCQGHLSALAPAAAPAQAVSGLWWAMLAGSGVLFALVLALFVWAARPSERPRSAHGRRWIFWGAVVLPALVLPPLVAWGLWVGEQRAQPRPGALIVRVTARAIFPNCPRYIPGLQLVEPSIYTPTPGTPPVEPAWKGFDAFKDVVHPRQSVATGERPDGGWQLLSAAA